MSYTRRPSMAAARADLRSLALFAVHTAGHPANVLLTAAGVIPLPLAVVIGTVLYNLSFTIWHEAVHQTITRRRALNSAVGWVTSALMIYPGFFFQRREHLLHHKYQGDPEKDPVYPRVMGSPIAFPWMLLKSILFNRQPRIDERVATPAERRADLAGYALAGAAIATGVWLGHGAAVAAAWLVPRAIILPLHAFYVCYLPHAPGAKGTYESYRVVLRNPLTRYLTLYHSFHGLHHLWPTIPWHRYREVFEARRAELAERGVEIR